MNSQQFSKELRVRRYSCVFCDSVRKRLDADTIDSELEMLYLEHNRVYHGLDK